MKMKRMDIILSQALEADFIYQCQLLHVADKYTKVPDVMGRGCSNPKMGDSVWPQLNSWYMMVVSADDAFKLKKLVESLRREYPDEGVGCFESEVEVL
jgi:hypothetical protein